MMQDQAKAINIDYTVYHFKILIAYKICNVLMTIDAYSMFYLCVKLHLCFHPSHKSMRLLCFG